ncbi:MAG: GHKL domain-containing protein, partial [Lactobacillus crispatus]|nr:GHKL domain-containing protein [Lactobacillus crispatus]MCT7714742.1 GHKL domain-containing protein [Lactobacillus crispatus]
SLILGIIFALLIVMNKSHIYNLLMNKNGLIFVELTTYIYISTMIVYFFTVKINRMTTLFEVSLSLLILQIIFSIFAYSTVVNIQKKLLTEQEQKEQKLQLELANADRKAKEVENRELVLKQQKLKSEMRQLQEYSSYLDKNEDDLRRFKHDYQNILNSLKVSAQEGDTTKVVKILDQYTNTQFDQKALRKYKGVNHIHEKNLKSIAIAKLFKLYSLDLNYSFDCEQNISQIPKSVNILDLVRIIGIAFDNAAEESMALIKETDSTNNARVDAMYYQENGDFEFEIRNRVREATIATDKMSQKNFTTKKHHMGLGLANVKEITHKYEDVMIVNYYVDDGWFTFDLTILPDDENEIED